MRLAASILILVGVLGSSVAGAKSRVSDQGRFVVTRVLIDPALDNNQQRYFTDDPRFVGRNIEIQAQSLVIDGGFPCTQVQRTRSRDTIGNLLKTKLPRRSPARRAYPTTVDMRFPPVQAGPIDVVEYRCIGPDRGRPGGIPGHQWTGVQNFPINSLQRGLLWEDEVILVLEPAAHVTSAKPSFDCKLARSATEIAICRDPVLASWDRSVAAAYERLLHGGGPDAVAPTEDSQALVMSQLEWLARRVLCGADALCLEDRMSERTDTLMRGQ